MAFPLESYSERSRLIRSDMAAAGIDALLITHLPNIAYLTGLCSSAGAVLISNLSMRLIVDSRYLGTANSLLKIGLGGSFFETVLVGQSYDEQIYLEIIKSGARRVGIESSHLTVQRWDWLVGRLKGAGVSLVPMKGLVEARRLVKDQDEIDILTKAGKLLAGAVESILKLVTVERTERDVAALIELTLASFGFDDRAFPTIVASGPNSAIPHARPTSRRIMESELVLLDFGGIYNGYHVDLSRTVCIGEVGEDARRFHEAVLSAQAASISSIRPGVLANKIDSAARSVLGEYGLADAFSHSTGHGLGLEIHEAPRIGRVCEAGTDLRIQEGMVFTVEPGVYVSEIGGVRIEDDVLVTSDGCEVLTGSASRELCVWHGASE